MHRLQLTHTLILLQNAGLQQQQQQQICSFCWAWTFFYFGFFERDGWLSVSRKIAYCASVRSENLNISSLINLNATPAIVQFIACLSVYSHQSYIYFKSMQLQSTKLNTKSRTYFVKINHQKCILCHEIGVWLLDPSFSSKHQNKLCRHWSQIYWSRTWIMEQMSSFKGRFSMLLLWISALPVMLQCISGMSVATPTLFHTYLCVRL